MSRPLLLALTTSLLLSLCAAIAPVRAAATSAANPAPKTLRYAFRTAETSFDPAQITDLYSRTVAANIFDAPLEFAFMARPFQVRPNTAAAMPEVAADFKTITLRIQPGIYFADDPVFQGKKRELTAQDYVYSIKRHYDPRWKSGNLYVLENTKLLGLSELRKALIAANKPFDYDTEVEGVRALDRYTLQLRFGEPQPRFLYQMADGALLGALAREVVEHYDDKIGAHPVGTGPYRLTQWVRSSKIVLERNPNYREVLYDEQPPADNARLQAIAAKFKGRKLPLNERVEVSIIEENQPRWLAFLNTEQDLMDEVPVDFAPQALPNNQLAPHLVKRGITMERYTRADISASYFAMENPLVGGYTPAKVALRRAIALAVDLDSEIRLVRRGQAIPAQSTVGPNTWGYDAAFKSEMSEFDRAKAHALLDMHGYIDRDGDGWRDQPDGQPLLLEYSTQPDQEKRQLAEHWKKNMDAIGIRIVFKYAKFPEQLKASRSGKLMMWGVGWLATQPDADSFLELGYGPNKGQANHARFDLPAYNALHERQRTMADGPERAALVEQAKKLLVAYMPYKAHVHRVFTDLAHPWVKGYHRNIFARNFWKYVDVDMDEHQRRSQR
ncbi:ABC transporter substrate-binding protein [Aquabacterium sp.]|uniref:ABC transporter substrate-binding protein n=1 Tax=Aquabacterium sp. TaxID=1872578 RepID=UPI002C09946E|nr:ABC transporter substrate-binding protein [Aquabacterium sp.]HSW05366.1 ABC transporter substrate-binding protein [Aquabacterium sp.]